MTNAYTTPRHIRQITESPNPAYESRTSGAANRGLVVTVNGWTCRQGYWNPLTKPLVEKGYRQVGFDVYVQSPGYSRANADDGREGYFDQVAKQLAWLVSNKLHTGEPFHLMGHSKGGLVTLAYLRLVAAEAYANVRPTSVTFFTPVTGNPNDTFPSRWVVRRLAAEFTRWRVRRTLASVQDGGDFDEPNEERSHTRVGNTLTAFQAASPALIAYMGGDWPAIREFCKFLAAARESHRRTTLAELRLMREEGPGLLAAMTNGEIYVPQKVLLVGATADALVDAGITEERMGTAPIGMSNGFRAELIRRGGHFPFRERPGEVLEMLGSILG